MSKLIVLYSMFMIMWCVSGSASVHKNYNPWILMAWGILICMWCGYKMFIERKGEE